MSLLDRIRYLLITGFGLGLAPFAPGTFGTLAGLIPAVWIGYALSVRDAAITFWALSAVFLLWGCLQSAFSDRVFQRKDPGAFVLDEVVGFWVAAAIYFTWIGALSPVGWALCFALFRVFDIVKVQPAKRLEEFPGAWGIMLDDVAAGVWAGLVLVGAQMLGLH